LKNLTKVSKGAIEVPIKSVQDNFLSSSELTQFFPLSYL
jgi:hypothetical protein